MRDILDAMYVEANGFALPVADGARKSLDGRDYP